MGHTTDGGPEHLQALRQQAREAAARASALEYALREKRPQQPRTIRATHRVDTPGRPPLFACREQDAMGVAEDRLERGERSEMWVSPAGTTGYSWWRSVP